MSETRSFQRNTVASPLMIQVLAGFMVLNGLANFAGREWIWGAADLGFAALAWVDMRWSKRTPAITVDAGEVVVRRNLFSRSRRIPLPAIASIDDSHPASARLVLRDGQAVVIPLHWLAWNDRMPFVAYLRSVVGSVGSGSAQR